MTRRIALAALLVGALVAVTAAVAAPPTPGPEAQKTGYDITVVDIGTTGPDGQPNDNTPVFTFQNVGTRTIHQFLSFTYKSNGQVIATPGAFFSLQPGQKKVWTGGPTDRSFAPYGATLEVTIDSHNELREDNENNNTMTRTLVDPRKAIRRPRP